MSLVVGFLSNNQVETLAGHFIPFSTTALELPRRANWKPSIMSDPDLFCRNIEETLKRYYEAALTLANAKEEPVSPDASLQLDEVEGAGMQDMLRRQATSLLQMYDAGKGECSGDGAAFARIAHRLKDVELASHGRLYVYRFDQVPLLWRQVYSDAQILTTFHVLLVSLPRQQQQQPFEEQKQGFLNSLDEVIARLDRALVIAGGGGRERWIEQTIKMLHETWERVAEPGLDGEFSSREPFGRPTLTRPCARHQGWDINRFERYMAEGHALAASTGAVGPAPVVFTDLTGDAWPALRQGTWARPDYLFRQTTGGRRLVPVEIGRSYVDAGWGQELLPFKDFLVRFIDSSLTFGDAAAADPTASAKPRQTGYLAQHNLFAQVPALRNDILVPDLCWASAPSRHPLTGAARPKLPLPELNAWFGPAGTITPLHTDGYNNLLCQAVGSKYVRLYPPQAGGRMRPMSSDEGGVDMSNTSAIDLGAIEGWDADVGDDDDEETREHVQEQRDSLQGVEYFECILEPGDTLLIPVGWWHCVRSLSISFSVSFWWN